MIELRDVLAEPVDWRFKSFPVVWPPPTVGEVEGKCWKALDGDFSLPVLVLNNARLDHNIQLMAQYCREHGVSLAPHAKTPVAPQIVARQLAAGAWGISVANLHQARVFRRVGARRILVANEVVDEPALRWFAEELSRDEGLEIICLVDSEVGVQLMEAALDAAGASRPLAVLVELGVPGGRCGCRTLPEAVAVARAVAESDHLILVGVEAYEAMIATEPLSARLDAIDALMVDLRLLVSALDREGLLARDREVIVSAGGSLFFDRVSLGLGGAWPLSQSLRVILRSGSYITQDGAEYAALSPLAGRSSGGPLLAQALELWAHVLSRPEPGLAVLGFGKRDVAHDRDLPMAFAKRVDESNLPLRRGDLEVYALNDQHARAHVRVDLELQPGDRVGFHISHPCTTFDNWRLVPLVDDHYRVLGAIRSYL